jgi:hypothetical protein
MERTKTFVNGGRVYPADLNAIEDRAAEMLEGTFAAIPGSHFAGRYYRATDTKKLYIDDGTTWVEVYSGSATIGDSAIVTGRALVNVENSYTANVERASGAEVEPSATRLAFVLLTSTGNTMTKVLVKGVEITKGGTTFKSISFICPPKVKWKCETEGGFPLWSSTLLL